MADCWGMLDLLGSGPTSEMERMVYLDWKDRTDVPEISEQYFLRIIIDGEAVAI